MNKYQKQRSKEIKRISRCTNMRGGKVIGYLQIMTYKEAKRIWSRVKKLQYFHPCEDCDNSRCKKWGKPIVYCPERM